MKPDVFSILWVSSSPPQGKLQDGTPNWSRPFQILSIHYPNNHPTTEATYFKTQCHRENHVTTAGAECLWGTKLRRRNFFRQLHRSHKNKTRKDIEYAITSTIPFRFAGLSSTVILV
jgi:hypothetical protein